MAQRKNKQAGKDQRARERARQRGQRRASRRNRPYLAWNHLTRDQKEVAKRIMAGDYRQIRHGGWGFLDKFLIFLKTIGFLQCLDVAGEGYTRRMITIAKLLLTYQVKIDSAVKSQFDAGLKREAHYIYPITQRSEEFAMLRSSRGFLRENQDSDGNQFDEPGAGIVV